MGLLSVHGKERADELKRANRESHPAIYARMLGIEPGAPELPLPDEPRARGKAFAARHALRAHGPAIGLNTGAAGRWESKRLSIERSVALARELSRRTDGRASFVVLGGPAERERNAAILAALAPDVRAVDGGTDNALLDFAALIGELDLLVASDSLALHLAVSQRVPVVAFFAPTSAAEIELYGRGEKVASLAPDACSYRPDADTSTLTVERLAAAAERVLAARAAAGPRGEAG
jgi:heptosyltransferase-2